MADQIGVLLGFQKARLPVDREVSLDICGHSMSFPGPYESHWKPLQGWGYDNIGRKRSEHSGRHCPLAVNLLVALFIPSNANWVFHKLFGNFP
jgi:hypothetical protein